jgi:hypothetical protein
MNYYLGQMGTNTSEEAVDPDPSSNHARASDLGGPAYADFLEAFRKLQDGVAESNPPDSE